jgi:ubiquinone/menaquinone biosynthesis C-methylase UbiE
VTGIRHRAPVAVLLLAAAASLGACKPGNGESALPQHYDDKQAALASFDDPERDAWAKPDEVVGTLVMENPRATVADIGAGSGYFTRRLAKRVPSGKVYAVDIDRDFASYIEDHRDEWGTPNIEPRLAMYENPLLPEGEIDLVFVSNTYAYIQDRVTYFQAVHKALVEAGSLVIIDFRLDAQCDGIEICPAAGQRVAKAEALAELSQAGFSLETEHAFLPHQYFLVLRKTP